MDRASHAFEARPEQAVMPRDERLRAAVAAHYDVLWRTLRRLGVPERSVEDAAQQVLIVFSRRLDDVRSGAERAFLLATATRVASELRRKQARAREDLGSEQLASWPSQEPSVDDLIDQGRAREALDLVLSQLPDELRTVFVLCEFEDLTMATIADTLGLPPGTVASRLRRARARFEAIAARLNGRGRLA